MDTIARSLIAAIRRHRRWWLAAAAIIFVAGCAVSLLQLDFDLSDIWLLPAAVILLVMAPLTQIYGTVGLLLLSRGSHFALSFGQAFRIQNTAQLAEILPFPGGAIIRTGALVEAGAGVVKGAALITLGALLWLAVASAAAGVALQQLTHDRRYLLFTVGSAVVITILLIQLARLTRPSVAISLLAHRVTGCLLVAVRLTLAFAAIGMPLPVSTAFVFGLANIAGSAASIAPAGLGLSELFGAAIASVIGVDPFAAFLAIALNRLFGLVINGAIFATLETRASLRRG